MTPAILPEDVFTPRMFQPGTRRILAAYSGGLDSHVLLHLLHGYRDRLKADLIAVHVDHGLSGKSAEWARHCQSVCEDLGMAFELVELDARAPKGESQEAWARKLRYQALEALMREGDILYTAHHMDDQAETLLLQLFRGAGPAGLAAIPPVRRFGKGYHLRPLLGFARHELARYAGVHGLDWIEDESNAEEKYDRNFLRESILPRLKSRWPSIAVTLSRAARHQAEAAALLEDLARIDVAACAVDGTKSLSASALLALPRHRMINALRYWIRQQGHAAPAEKRLTRVIEDVLGAGPDAEPRVAVGEDWIRRYRDAVFISGSFPDQARRRQVIDWDIHEVCRLDLGELRASRGKGKGIKADACEANRLNVRFRTGGETLKRGGRHHELKKIFQEKGIPPCYRDHLPLVYVGDRLAAVADICIDEDFAAREGEEAILLHWEQDPKHPIPKGR